MELLKEFDRLLESMKIPDPAKYGEQFEKKYNKFFGSMKIVRNWIIADGCK